LVVLISHVVCYTSFYYFIKSWELSVYYYFHVVLLSEREILITYLQTFSSLSKRLMLLLILLWLLFRLTLLLITSSRLQKLNAVSHYFGYEYSLTVVVFVSPSLQSAIYSNLASFFHVVCYVFSRLFPYNKIDEICFVFSLLIFEWSITSYVSVSYSDSILRIF